MEERIVQLSDEVLCKRCTTDPEAFALIIERYTPKLTHYIRRRSSASRSDIEDLLQNIFIKVYRNINEYNDSLLFSSWIYRIAYHEMIDWYRKQKVRATISLDLGDEGVMSELIAPDDPMRQSIKIQEKKALATALNTLEEKYKDIIMLRYFEEKSYEEISDIMKIPPGTVAIRLNRAKALLKKALLEKSYVDHT